jgi:predicted transposase YdaD
LDALSSFSAAFLQRWERGLGTRWFGNGMGGKGMGKWSTAQRIEDQHPECHHGGTVGMETDKQLDRVFGAQPEWVFELAGMPSVGKCAMRSLTVKTLERRTDGVIIPENATSPLSVIEFQFGENPQVYTRTVQKMAAVQEEFDMREVQGVIFFGNRRFDPRTKPWTSLVRAIDLPDELRRLAERSPGHPLVAAFQPLLADTEAELERNAGGFLHTIKTSKLRIGVKLALEEVFMSWLGQRLPHRTKQEIEKMLVGELPELLDTRMAQDILKIGKEQGQAEGLAEGLSRAVFTLLGSRRGRLTKALRQRIRKLTNDQLCELLTEADAWESLDPLAPWLAKHGR